MSGLNHYLQTKTQSTPFNLGSSATLPTEQTTATMEVNKHKKYRHMMIHNSHQCAAAVHRQQQEQPPIQECRDDHEDEITNCSSSISNNAINGRDDCTTPPPPTKQSSPTKFQRPLNDYQYSPMEPLPKSSIICDTNNDAKCESTLGDEDDNDDEFDYTAFASTAEACVACSIPVLHFIQFFMC